ncbi:MULTISPECIES: hypothetical protein [unclassified Ruegeria]|uniref:hypothetical protein n=1 Tax=unclassified Ruegeria TaxID=2625375 RepID=UPI001ADC0AB8|nr:MULTISPECIES: hypothetical protein [unclassified Ruegeria]MBO9410877.1 hypothetical protein [Ruegeria sp. R8_1]MBO9415078.1 hypothetical protein [Ruegeria sp. R8_2]
MSRTMKYIPLIACVALAGCGDLVTIDLDTAPDGPVRGEYRTVLSGIPADVTARAHEAEVNFTETGSSIGYGKLFALADTELRRVTGCRDVAILSDDVEQIPGGARSAFVFGLDECPAA